MTSLSLPFFICSILISPLILKEPLPVLYPVFDDLKKSFDYEEYGGTPLLGVNGIVTKCHGSSNHKAIENALLNIKVTTSGNSLTLKPITIRAKTRYPSAIKGTIT